LKNKKLPALFSNWGEDLARFACGKWPFWERGAHVAKKGKMEWALFKGDFKGRGLGAGACFSKERLLQEKELSGGGMKGGQQGGDLQERRKRKKPWFYGRVQASHEDGLD